MKTNMETVNQPKKKDGRFYLKKKIAKLQEENATLVEQLHEARDAWSEANAQKLSIEADLIQAQKDLKFVKQMRDFIGERYVWLYEHAPFWLKWWFKKTFNGATK